MNKKFFAILGAFALLATLGAGCGQPAGQPSSQIEFGQRIFSVFG